MREVTELATSAPLKSLALLRTEFYRMLRLPEPELAPESSTVLLPDTVTGCPVVQAVRVTLDHRDGVLRANATGFAAETVLRGHPPANGTHVVVSTAEPRDTALQLADIIVHHHPGDAESWISRTLTALPGAQLATTPLDRHTWLIGTRDGRSLRVRTTGRAGSA